MSIGILKFGNNYNFKATNVVLFKGETRDTLRNLDKVSIRYNTRPHFPNYPAMKALYKWRAVFGYRLGGLLRRAVVKFSEIGRHTVNAKNYYTALKNARAEARKPEPELDLKKLTTMDENRPTQARQLREVKVRPDLIKTSAKETKKGEYLRLYSTRDVILAKKSKKQRSTRDCKVSEISKVARNFRRGPSDSRIQGLFVKKTRQ
ncbi:hypothetical protein [Rhizobium sp. FKL33]|uniref:hypothetical protein n=1 Tax=Rhizobium sp. FKL33 TaxID=2562307 RepID=UPI0010C0B352|nr:hypothetical protein [Rhizobium sp. FKL33]